MRITIIATGTRGDVQPLLALGRALQQQGDAVRMLASAHFGPWIAQHGLEAAPTQIDTHTLMASVGGEEWMTHGTNPLRQTAILRRLLNQVGRTMIRDTWEACADAQVIISSFTSDVYAASFAEKLGAMHISTPLQPAMQATRCGASLPGAPFPARESVFNALFGRLVIEPFGWRLLGAMTNQFRQQVLGLRPQTFQEYRQAMRHALIVQAYSAYVVPHAYDWPANIHTTGYWFLDESIRWQPPLSLIDFLNAGDPPIAIGFGSMTGRDPQALTRLIVEAVVRSKQRAILQGGWAGLGDTTLPDAVYQLDTAPHSWLFPRVRAVVHHGGAGTTGEGLRWGCPTVVVPHIADQPFWGQRVQALGVGPRPILRPQLTVERLADAIHRVTTDSAMRQRAEALGERIRSEDGIAAAVALLYQRRMAS